MVYENYCDCKSKRDFFCRDIILINIESYLGTDCHMFRMIETAPAVTGTSFQLHPDFGHREPAQ